MVASTQRATFWDWLIEFPPILVRLAARRGAGGAARSFDSAEIACMADIPRARVEWISEQFSWDDIPVGEMRRFCEACAFDPTRNRDRQRQRDYLYTCQTRNQTQPPAYLRRHPAWETELLPLLLRLKSRMTSSTASNSSSTSNGRNYAGSR